VPATTLPDLPPPTAVPEAGEADAPGVDEGEEAEEPTEATPPPAEDPLDPADIPELEFGSLDPVEGGLASLGTFRQRMTVDFTGDEVGYNGVYVYESEVNSADQAIRVTIHADGEAVESLPANQLQAIWVESNLWIQIGNQPWLPMPTEAADVEFDQQFFGVSAFLPYVQAFERVGEEDVNGISCAHYTYDAEDLPTQNGTFSGRGDVYVALEGGYVVRYTLSGSGDLEAPFQGGGWIDLVYNTYDIGAEIVVRPPRR
jgi:hypothetical protein